MPESLPARQFRLTPRALVLLLLAGLFAWGFADALFRGGVFVFRDAGHYYHPLFQFIRGEWSAGRLPLWNPYENLGVPLAGNPTSCVFYPGTLLFFLPIDFAWAYKFYVMGHLALAAWAAYRLGRHWGGSVEASGAGAMSYAFSGNVLFQYCNVIYLVGAAWLPLAVLAADRMLAAPPGEPRHAEEPGKRVRSALLLGAVLALMALGGNAEMAYHAGLIAAMYAVWLWRAERRSGRSAACAESGRPIRAAFARLAGSRPAVLGLAAGAAFVLAAVQVLPSAELSRRSGRARAVAARNVYELPAHLQGGGASHWADGLLCRRLEPGTHHRQVYHFSVGPWRLAEYVWPNLGGRQFPRHRRWFELLPGGGRLWVPSLYMGLFPLLLALGAFRLRKGTPRQTWLSWVAVLSVLAGFGAYGLAWVVHQVQIAAGSDPAGPWRVGAPVGGLYWLMTVLLPGYIYFRYPAKLLVLAALALSMLAVHGWDRAVGGPWPRGRRCLLVLGGLSLGASAVAVATFPLHERWWGRVAPNVLFGPLDVPGAGRDLALAFAQTALLCGAGWWLLRRAPRAARSTQAAALVLVAVDLAAGNGWMISCAPAREWEKQPKLAAVIRADRVRRGDGRPFRVFRHPVWLPPSFRTSGSLDRIPEGMRWDRDTLFPKYNLAPRIAVMEVQGTMKPYDYQVFLWAAKQGADDGPDDLFLARYLILPGDDRPHGPEAVPLEGTPAAGLEDVSLWRAPSALPRAWVVHRVETLAPLDSHDPYTLWRRTRRVFFPAGRPRNLRESAVVEADEESGEGDTAQLGSKRASTARVVRYCPCRIEMEAELDRPGLVVLADQFYPGWRLEVETAGRPAREVPILRTNRVMRGAWLPAGRHRLTYRYRPASIVRGAWFSGLGWLALAATGLATVAAGHRRRNARKRPA